MTAFVIVQSLSFVVLGVWFLTQGKPKLGLAQLLLAGVNFLVYT